MIWFDNNQCYKYLLFNFKNQIKSLFNPRDVIEELRSSDLPAEVVLDRQRKKQIEHDMAEKEKAERIKRIKQGLFSM